MMTKVTEMKGNLSSDHKERKDQEAQIKAMNKQIRSLRKQLSVLSDSGEDDVDCDAEDVDGGGDDEYGYDARCQSTTNPHALGRTTDSSDSIKFLVWYESAL